jgi:hypothetical protein
MMPGDYAVTPFGFRPAGVCWTMRQTNQDRRMPKAAKLVLACLVCLGIVTALVLFFQWLS